MYILSLYYHSSTAHINSISMVRCVLVLNYMSRKSFCRAECKKPSCLLGRGVTLFNHLRLQCSVGASRALGTTRGSQLHHSANVLSVRRRRFTLVPLCRNQTHEAPPTSDAKGTRMVVRLVGVAGHPKKIKIHQAVPR